MKLRIQFASDVSDRDGMGVELTNEQRREVYAELFRNDETGCFHLNTFGNEVPAEGIRMMFDAAVEREGLSFAIPSEKAAVIYIELKNDGVRCYRPVLAHSLGGNVYRIDSSFDIPEGEHWHFMPGDTVRCEDRSSTGGLNPVAVVNETSREPFGSHNSGGCDPFT